MAHVGYVKSNHASNTVEVSTVPAQKLAYTLSELCAALGLCRVTLYRLEQRGLLRPVPGIRHKLYSRAEVDRFLNGRAA